MLAESELPESELPEPEPEPEPEPDSELKSDGVSPDE